MVSGTLEMPGPPATLRRAGGLPQAQHTWLHGCAVRWLPWRLTAGLGEWVMGTLPTRGFVHRDS